MPEMNNFKSGNNIYEVADKKSRGVPLTWAQYQALSYEEQHNGTAYYITDMDAVYPVDHELNANSRNAVANDIVTQHILAMENALGAKNILPVSLNELKAINTSGSWDDNVYTNVGMTLTVNKDCSITLNGTPTEDLLFFFEYASDIYANKNLSYIMTGCPSNGSTETYWIESYIRNNAGQSVRTIRDTGDGVVFNISDIPNAEFVDVVMIIVKANVTVNNIVFKPMIRPVGTDPTYVQYAKTNKELTDDLASLPDLDNVQSYSGDADNMPAGVYICSSSNTTNLPPLTGNRLYTVLCCKGSVGGSGSYGMQIAIAYPDITFIRRNYSGYANWVRIDNNPETDHVSVTADGVKTYTALFNELFALIDANKLSYKSRLRLGNAYVSIAQITNNYFVFDGIVDFMIIGKLYTYCVYLSAGNSAFMESETDATQTLFTNHSPLAAPSGQVITLYY